MVRTGKVTNPYYRAFLEGYLIQEIPREDIILVMDNIMHRHLKQARCLVLICWATGARPNEVLRLTPECFNKTKEFLEIKMPSSKGSSARTISLPCKFLDGSDDPLILEIYEYIRGLFPSQWLFWFFRSNAIRIGTTKSYTKKDGTIVKKHYDKIYDELGSKLRYYYPRWFKIIFPDGGIPPYYLRHNRGTMITDLVSREAAQKTLGHKSELTTNRYIHLTKRNRKEIAKGLMK